MSDSDAAVAALNLEALVLDECRVVRGNAGSFSPGEVESDVNVEFSRQEQIVFFVRATHRLLNADGEMVAQIDSTFAAMYSVGASDTSDPVELSDDQLEGYGGTALMIQVIPFLREFLASMTNRLGLPTFYLPLFKRGASLLAGISRPREDPTEAPHAEGSA
jgi:hypothetical protein